MSEERELQPVLGAIQPLPLTLDEAEVKAVALTVREMMTPLLETIGKMLENNTQAMDQIAAAQQMTSDRIEALEKQVRLTMPMTGKQAQYINDAIRARARELLDKRGFADDKKAVTRLANAIRKSVLARYGVGGVREIPKCEYTVTMSQIERWNNSLAVLDVVKEARGRAKEAVPDVDSAGGVDGAPQDAGTPGELGERGSRISDGKIETTMDAEVFK